MSAFGFGNVGGAVAEPERTRHPFTYPTGTWHVPLTSTTPFGLRRGTNTGQAIASAARVDSQDFVSGNAIANSIQFTTGTAYLEAGLGYVFQSGDGHPAGAAADTAGLGGYHILLRVRIGYGGANKTTTFNFTMTTSRTGASWGTNYYKMSLATNTLIVDSGVYTFSICPSGPGWVTNGTFDIGNVGALTMSMSCADFATQQNTIEILDFAVVPKPTRPGILVLHCDDVDTCIELCDWLDTNIPGAKATLYVRTTDAAGILKYQRVNNNGHLVCQYMETFTTPTGIDAQFAAQADLRNWLITNGFEKGSRFGVMGGGATWGTSYERAWPLWFDSLTFMDSGTSAQVHSPYHHSYMSRARHGSGGGIDWATTDGDAAMTALLTAAIADHGRMGVLIHDLGAPGNDEWDNFTDWLTTNVAPRVADGTLRVMNARDAYLSGF